MIDSCRCRCRCRCRYPPTTHRPVDDSPRCAIRVCFAFDELRIDVKPPHCLTLTALIECQFKFLGFSPSRLAPRKQPTVQTKRKRKNRAFVLRPGKKTTKSRRRQKTPNQVDRHRRLLSRGIQPRGRNRLHQRDDGIAGLERRKPGRSAAPRIGKPGSGRRGRGGDHPGSQHPRRHGVRSRFGARRRVHLPGGVDRAGRLAADIGPIALHDVRGLLRRLFPGIPSLPFGLAVRGPDGSAPGRTLDHGDLLHTQWSQRCFDGRSRRQSPR